MKREASRERGHARGVECPNCGAAIELRALAHTRAVACTSCAAVVDPRDPSCPIRLQCVPRLEESTESPGDLADPLAPFRAPDGRAPDADTVLERFLAAIAGRGLSLYPEQEEAILDLFGGSNVVHVFRSITA